MRHTFRRTLAITATLLACSSSAFAQEFTWTNTTMMKLGNVPGVIAKMLGSGKELTETNALSGHKLRVDVQNTAIITDADEGRMTTLDTKKKTYSTTTLAELAAAAEKSAKDAKDDKDDGSYLKFEVKVSRPGEKATIAGINAERVLITLIGMPDAATAKKDDMGMAFVIEGWSTKAAPHASALKAYYDALAAKTSRELGSGAGMQSLFSQYKGMSEGWENAWAELRKLDGTFIKTTTHVVNLPQGVKLDTEVLFAPKPEQKESAGGRFGRGLLGKVAGAAPSEQKGPPTAQMLIVSMTSELKEVKQGGVSGDMFTVPADYKEKK